MIEPNDPRLFGQEEYLTGKTFCRHKFEPRSECDDHAHCAFCWEKFSLYEGNSHDGYSTLDDIYWVCDRCFEDFRERFSFRVWQSDIFEADTLNDILRREVGSRKDLDDTYRADRVLRLLSKLQKAEFRPIRIKMTPVIMEISPRPSEKKHTRTLESMQRHVSDASVVDFREIMIRMTQAIKDMVEIDARYDNLYYRIESLDCG